MPAPHQRHLLEHVAKRPPRRQGALLIGILEGEGVGPELIACCRALLQVIETHTSVRFTYRSGGLIGKQALAASGQCLTNDVISFCRQLFRDGGALLCGPGGDRFVYDLRREFGLYCKLVPLCPLPALADTGPLRATAVAGVDILLVRENLGGLYQGEFALTPDDDNDHARHAFSYSRQQVDDILAAAIALARSRRQQLCVVTKPGGVPSISALWTQRALALVPASGVALQFLEVDNAAYQMVANASAFDVVVAPNLFGDVLGDCAALLLASRGMSYSANFSHDGAAVYQTGHGAAHDLTGTDCANPLGQILSLVLLLRESFGLHDIADALHAAMAMTAAAGFRTRDIAGPQSFVVGTRELTARLAAEFAMLLQCDVKTTA